MPGAGGTPPPAAGGKIKPSADEIEMAQTLGIDPQRLAEHNRSGRRQIAR
jgi:hypothetical protein